MTQHLTNESTMSRFALLFLKVFFFLAFVSFEKSDAVVWMSNYDEAARAAKDQNKPLVLFFTGSDWCVWCKKLESEALETKDFEQAAASQFVFVKIDFPQKGSQPAAQATQNKDLQKRFDVRGFPTIVILTPQGQKIGVTGYRPGGGKSYASHLMKMVEEFTSYKSKMSTLDKDAPSGAELKMLFKQARQLQQTQDIAKIIEQGKTSDRKDFFLIEEYRLLAKEGKIASPEAASLKKQLLTDAPKNSYLTHYQIACIDFDALSDKLESGQCTPETAVEPLNSYLERFGSKDRENQWRIEMIISQVYLDKREKVKAIRHAEKALQSAPEGIKEDIQSYLAEAKK